MSQPENVFTQHLVYRRSDRWLDLSTADKAAMRDEVTSILARHEDVQVRGTYSAVGLRPDSDIVFWLLADAPEPIQRVAVELRQARFGSVTELTWSFMGFTHKPEFVGNHYAAFQLGWEPLRWLCLYPFVRTPEWYLLGPAERGRMLKEHGEMGREFEDVHTNNVEAFGLGDYEWILAFETDHPESLVRLVRRLREAEARRYTKLDVPFILGQRKPASAVLKEMG